MENEKNSTTLKQKDFGSLKSKGMGDSEMDVECSARVWPQLE